MNAHHQQLGRSAALAARDSRVLWHPCTQMKDHETLPPIPIKRGEGVWLEAEMDIMVRVAAEGIELATCD